MNPRTLFCRANTVRRTTVLPPLPALCRTHITIPHPDLDPANGHTRFVVRAWDGIPSLIHAYAILRAVEGKLGASVLHLKIPKQLDSLSFGPLIFLETLKPVKLDQALLLEIPAPNISPESNFLGGPSLSDISAVLSSTPDATPTVQTSPPGGRDAPIQFKVEAQRSRTRDQHRPAVRRNRSKQGGREGAEIVHALKAFDGGFYGGFAGVSEKFATMLENHQGPPETMRERQRERSLKSPTETV